MANIRPVSGVLRRKTSGLLDGLLGMLYQGSRAEENPDYANPGGRDYRDENFDAETVQPFRGRGIFGGREAAELNNRVALNRIAQQQKISLEQALADRLAGEEGAALATLFQNLSPEEQVSLNLPQLGQAPISDKFRSQLVRAYGGNQYTSEGFAGLPAHRTKQQLTPFGSGGQLNVVTGEEISPTKYIEEHDLVPIMGTGIDPNTGQFREVVKGYKQVSRSVEKPAGTRKLINYNVTQDELNSVADAGTHQDLELSDAEIYGARNITPKGPVYSSGISERPAPASSGAEMTVDDAKAKAPVITPKPQLQGALPELGRGMVKGIQALGPDFSGAGIGPELGTTVDTAGTELSNLRKFLIRNPGETNVAPKVPLGSLPGRLKGVAETAGEKMIEPFSDLYKGLVLGGDFEQEKLMSEELARRQQYKRLLQGAMLKRLQKQAFEMAPVEAPSPMMEPLIPENNMTRSILRSSRRNQPRYGITPY